MYKILGASGPEHAKSRQFVSGRHPEHSRNINKGKLCRECAQSHRCRLGARNDVGLRRRQWIQQWIQQWTQQWTQQWDQRWDQSMKEVRQMAGSPPKSARKSSHFAPDFAAPDRDEDQDYRKMPVSTLIGAEHAISRERSGKSLSTVEWSNPFADWGCYLKNLGLV